MAIFNSYVSHNQRVTNSRTVVVVISQWIHWIHCVVLRLLLQRADLLLP